MIDREKFKTELGKQLYDVLKPIAPSEDWLYLMFMMTKGDYKKNMVMNFINDGNKNWVEIHNFIENNFKKDIPYVEL